MTRNLVSAIIFILSASSWVARPLAAKVPADAAMQVDAIFARWSSIDSPGCAVGIALDGLTVFSRAYGMADLEHDIPNNPGTIFEGGSVSKQFTAAAVVLLALEGKLSLDDDVRKYIPEVPDYGSTLTLQQMMNHTNGLRDWGSVAAISGWGRQTRTHRHAHVLDILGRQSALNFEPGSDYSYSNSGYNLLAVVVSRVSGMSFADFSKKHLFEPLGLTHTEWRDDYTRIVKGRSTAYSVRDGKVAILRPIENVHGNGGILTTVGDLLLWNRSLTDERLGAAFGRMMHARGRLIDGREIAYASGLRISTLGGVPSITHTGSTSGYRAFLGRFPDQRLSVAMLCNASNVPTGETGEKIARVFLGDKASMPEPPAGAPPTIESLEKRVGLYLNRTTFMRARIELRDEALYWVGRAELVPVTASVFQAGARGPRVVFLADGIEVHLADNEIVRYESVEPFEPSSQELAAFAGEYYSADAETAFAVSLEEGELNLRRRPDWVVSLMPEYRDAFDAPGLGLVRFHRDVDGQVIELSLSQARVHDMRFQRQ